MEIIILRLNSKEIKKKKNVMETCIHFVKIIAVNSNLSALLLPLILKLFVKIIA